MKIISEPLNIGAGDLLKGVEYTHCGVLHVLTTVKFHRKKWKQRYIIISQGCLYIYTDKNSKKTEQACSLKDVDCARECEPECGEKICFCLRYKKPQAPLIFSSDTPNTREEWLGHFCSAIADAQSAFLSADSGIGSAETVPKLKFEKLGIEAYGNYVEVDQSQFGHAEYLPVQLVDGKSGIDDYGSYVDVDQNQFGQAEFLPVQPVDEEAEYEIPVVTTGSNTTHINMFYENVQLVDAGKKENQVQRKRQHDVKITKPNVSRGPSINQDTVQETNGSRNTGKITGQQQREVEGARRSSNILMDELKSAITSKVHKPKVPPKPDALASKSNRSGPHENFMKSQASVLVPSLSSTASSFVSVRGGGGDTLVDESEQYFSVRGQESLNMNNDDTDNSTNSGDTSPEIIYENPEPQKFEKETYFCQRKKQVKRIMNQTPEGTFAIYPGETTELELCVMTKNGLKYFRVFSQNGRVSLFKSQSIKSFPSLDDLLSYYYINDLPAKDYSAKLRRGYNSV